MAKQITVSAGRPYGHVPGHTYLDVDIQAVDRTAILTITWGSAQGRDEEHGREEYTRRAKDLESAIEAVRDAALVEIVRSEDQQGEVRRYVEMAASRALAECMATEPRIKIVTRAQNPEDDYREGGPLYGYNPDAVTLECYDERAEALYRALGVARDDADYSIGALVDGRWALVGLDAEGHRCAVENLPELSPVKDDGQ